jgi:transposase
MIWMLLVGHCYGIRSERRLCQEVELHLAYRWFCKLDLDDAIPHHSTFSVNRLGRLKTTPAGHIRSLQTICEGFIGPPVALPDLVPVHASADRADRSRI